jgi:hypothetical protein
VSTPRLPKVGSSAPVAATIRMKALRLSRNRLAQRTSFPPGATVRSSGATCSGNGITTGGWRARPPTPKLVSRTPPACSRVTAGKVALLIPPVPKVVSSEPLALNRATLTRFGVKAGSQRKDRDRRAFVEYLRRGPLRVRLGD